MSLNPVNLRKPFRWQRLSKHCRNIMKEQRLPNTFLTGGAEEYELARVQGNVGRTNAINDIEEIVWTADIINKLQNRRIKSLRDNKLVSMLFGLFSPFRHELPEYLGYDITRFKDHFRVLEVLLNREGEANSMVPLWFDGATNSFAELPQPPWAKWQKEPGINCSSCIECRYKDCCELRQWYERSEEYNQMNCLVVLEWKRRINRRWWYALVSLLRERWMRKRCAKESYATSTKRNTVYLTVI